MSNLGRWALAGALGVLAACGTSSDETGEFGFPVTEVDPGRLPARIAFGSCADQTRPQEILWEVTERKPDLFVWLGDNIYGDSREIEVLEAKYRTLAARPEFRQLRAACPNLAVWDDHDYGENDAGKDYPLKEASRELFLEFWGVPSDSERRAHAGIYHVHRFEDGGRQLQIILLDTRSFRDELAPAGKEPGSPWKNDYRPLGDPNATLLGAEQWAWLERVLAEPADLRIIASSIQFGHSYNGWESWTNLPRERDRMIETIRRTRANGVLFISGDVHWGEISRQEVPGGYPLHDVTASGINQDWPTVEPNTRRVGPVVREYNFGMIEIDWAREDPTVSLLSIDREGEERNRVDLPLLSLRFSAR